MAQPTGALDDHPSDTSGGKQADTLSERDDDTPVEQNAGSLGVQITPTLGKRITPTVITPSWPSRTCQRLLWQISCTERDIKREKYMKLQGYQKRVKSLNNKLQKKRELWDTNGCSLDEEWDSN